MQAALETMLGSCGLQLSMLLFGGDGKKGIGESSKILKRRKKFCRIIMNLGFLGEILY